MLERSRQSPLDLNIILRSINPYVHDQYAFKGNESRLSQACQIIQVHLHRIRHLSFSGPLGHLFPLDGSLHNMKSLKIDCRYGHRRLTAASREILIRGLLRSQAPKLDAFSIEILHGSMHSYLGINPRGLRHLGIPMSVGKNDVTREFIRQCNNLFSLQVDMRDYPDDEDEEVDDHIGTIYVSEFRLLGPAWRLPFMVTSAPMLVHLILWDPITWARSTWHDGPRALHTKERIWPEFPHLRTLSICHPSVGEIIPCMRTSPHIIALHLSGGAGFWRTLSHLNTPYAQSADRHTLSYPLCNLKHLRIWIYPSIWVDKVEEAQDDWGNIWSALVVLLERREDLDVEICSRATVSEEKPPWDPVLIERHIKESCFGSRVRFKHLGDGLYDSPSQNFKAPLAHDFPCLELEEELRNTIPFVNVV